LIVPEKAVLVLLLPTARPLVPKIRVLAPESEPTAWLLAVDRLAPDATVRSVPAANVCALDSARLPATMLIVVWPAAMAASSWACVLISTARTGVGTTASDRQRPALTSALPDKSARRAHSRAGHLRARATSPPRSHSENGYIVGFPNEFPSQSRGQE